MPLNSFGYELDSVSSNYIKYRPTYPEELYERILKSVDEDSNGVKRRGLAVDIGCGSGQSTWPLAKSFDAVIGVDSSEAQVNEARIEAANYKNITFRVGSAENLSEMFDEGSVDLITVGTALHWFDIDKFFKECLKILKVGGTFAAFGCFLPNFDNPKANGIVHKVFYGALNGYYPPERVRHADNMYRELFPVMPNYFRQCTRDDSIIYRAEYSLEAAICYLKSHPPYHLYKADHPEEPDIFSIALEKLQIIYGTKSLQDKVAKTSNQIPLIMGKK